MKEILLTTKPLLIIVAIVFVLVFIAIMIDLVSGLYKAKINHVLRTSKALRLTINKFIQYEGSVIIAFIMDVFLHLSTLWTTIHIVDLNSIPIIALLVGTYLCIIEIISVRENADVKERKHEKLAIDIIKKVFKTLGPDKAKKLIEELDKEDNKE